AISRKRYHTLKFGPPAPWDARNNQPSHCDHLWVNRLLPSLSEIRLAAKLLLQNAWRSPGGRTDSREMKEAIMACLRIARQHETLSPVAIQALVALSVREMAYDSALRALEAGIFDDADIAELNDFFAREDRRPLSPFPDQRQEIAGLLD